MLVLKGDLFLIHKRSHLLGDAVLSSFVPKLGLFGGVGRKIIRERPTRPLVGNWIN